jgi:hypothetical protein
MKDRRELLKGLAVGSVWATPVVSSVVLPVHAATSGDKPSCGSKSFDVNETLLGSVECKDIGFVGYYWVEWFDGCPSTNSGPISPEGINALVIKVDDNGGSETSFQVLIQDEDDTGSLGTDQECPVSNFNPNDDVKTANEEELDQGNGITYKWSATLTGSASGISISVSDITLSDIVNSNS